MSLWEFLQRLDADPFDPAITSLFLDSKNDNDNKNEEDATK